METLAELPLKTEQKEKVLEILCALEELDDIQNIYTNAKMEKLDNENNWN